MATIAIRSLLPAQPTPLVGRADELATIRRRLADEGVRLLTLVGPAGVGKTRLALAAAAQLADAPDCFPDGITLVDLTPVRDPHLVLGAIARALGLLDVGGRPVLEHLVEALGERQQLLVLDNFEQVLPAAPALPDLLAACPGLALLVTSRVPLPLRWERALRVAPLPVPDPAAPLPPLDELAAIPSVALFVQRARARRDDFALGDKHASLVARLVSQLDGLPLALELAAARTATLPLPALARRLGDRLRLLRWEAADVPERQRSLEAAVGWSYDLLGEGERRLFRCLGVFVGRVSLDAIAAVAHDAGGGVDGAGAAGGADGDGGRALEGLLSLAEQSLVLPARPAELAWQQGGTEDADEADAEHDEEADPEPAFGMLETVREYAEERLAAEGELAAARRAHAAYFLTLAERADTRLHGRDQRAWLFRLEREHDNLRAALRWLLDRDDPAERERAVRLAGALGDFWWFRGYHTEGAHWLEEALARAPEGEATDPAVRTKALYRAGALLMFHGELARARTILEEALSLARQRHDPAGSAWSLAFLGMCAVYSREAAGAASLLREALDRARELGEPYPVGMALFFLGVTVQTQGNATEAAAHYKEALDLLEAAGSVRTAAAVHFYLGAIVGQQGDLAAAVRHIRAGLEASANLRDRWILSYGARAALAVVGDHTNQGDPVGRVRLLGAADALRQASGAGRGPWEFVAADPGEPGLRVHLPEGEWEAAYRGGRSLSAGDVVALALRLLDEVATPLPGTAEVPAVSKARTEPAAAGPHNPLSAREREVLRLVAQGRSNKAIGRELFLSASTVNYHLTSAFNKLDVDTRAQAVAVAAQRGLL